MSGGYEGLINLEAWEQNVLVEFQSPGPFGSPPSDVQVY